jgi:hypothetical protein
MDDPKQVKSALDDSFKLLKKDLTIRGIKIYHTDTFISDFMEKMPTTDDHYSQANDDVLPYITMDEFGHPVRTFILIKIDGKLIPLSLVGTPHFDTSITPEKIFKSNSFYTKEQQLFMIRKTFLSRQPDKNIVIVGVITTGIYDILDRFKDMEELITFSRTWTFF